MAARPGQEEERGNHGLSLQRRPPSLHLSSFGDRGASMPELGWCNQHGLLPQVLTTHSEKREEGSIVLTGPYLVWQPVTWARA